MRACLPLLIGGVVLGSLTLARAEEADWRKVDEALGRKPAAAGDVRRYAFPRSDLNVTLDGVTLKPALALGGWIAFKPAHGKSMVMGDSSCWRAKSVQLSPGCSKAAWKSPPCTIIYCARRPCQSTCMSAAPAIPSNWPARFGTRSPPAKRL